MTPKAKWLLLAAFLGPLGARASVAGAEPAIPAALSTQLVVRALESHEIEKVEVFGISLSSVTRRPIRPAGLERSFQFKVITADISGNFREEGLQKALQETALKPDAVMSDLRTGIVFYARNGGRRVAALYFDATGRRGAFNGNAVQFGGEFYQWLSEAYLSCLQDPQDPDREKFGSPGGQKSRRSE